MRVKGEGGFHALLAEVSGVASLLAGRFVYLVVDSSTETSAGRWEGSLQFVGVVAFSV